MLYSMNKGIWIAKKNELCSLIKQLSDACGGDDIDFLREYAKGIINDYRNDLNFPLDCFYYLFNELCKKTHKEKKEIDRHSRQCAICGYFPPFCYYQKNRICSNN